MSMQNVEVEEFTTGTGKSPNKYPPNIIRSLEMEFLYFYSPLVS